MGEAKRRKQLDPNYGKIEELSLEWIGYCHEVIKQESVFMINHNYLDNKSTIIEQSIENLRNQSKFKYLSKIYNFFCQESIMNPKIQEKRAITSGCFSVVHYGNVAAFQDSNDVKVDGNFDCDWLPISLIDKECDTSVKNGLTMECKLLQYLIVNCDNINQYPVWHKRIENNVSIHLMFIAS